MSALFFLPSKTIEKKFSSIPQRRKSGVGYVVNIKKTENRCTDISDDQRDIELEDGKVIKTYKEYKYLGGSLDQNIKDRNIQSRKTTAMLNSFLQNRQISKGIEKRMYNTVVKNIVKYSDRESSLSNRNGFLEENSQTVKTGKRLK